MSLPQVLLPYQQRWVADGSRVRMWEKSRRIGASWVCAAESVLEASRINGCSTWYTSYNKDTTAEFIRDCADWAVAMRSVIELTEEIEDIDGEQVLTFVIRFKTGHRITALSSNPANLRIRMGRIIIDEAAHNEQLAESMKAAMAIIMWGGRVDILSTHNGVDSHFNKLVESVRAGRLRYSLHRTTFDEAVAQGLYKRICFILGAEWTPKREGRWRSDVLDDYGEDADEELKCIPRRSGGTYISRPVIEGCMFNAPVLRFEAEPGFAGLADDIRSRVMLDWLRAKVARPLAKLNANLMHFFGEDFGRTADLTVIAPVVLNQNLTRTVPFILELRDTPFREQEQTLYYVVDRLPNFTYGVLDAGGNGQYLSERAWQRYGESRIEQVHLRPAWYGENFPKLRGDMEDRLMAIPRDVDVLSDLQAVRMLDGVPQLPNVRTKQIAGTRKRVARRHGDAAIAIVLGHYASRQELKLYTGYESVESSRARKGLD